MFLAVDTFDWLLMLHITGAFLLVGGSVAAGVLNTMALRAERPSDTALVLGLWLVFQQDSIDFFSFWILAALVLWAVMGALGGAGGKHQEKARRKAEQLAAAGDTSDDELRSILHDRRGNAMSWLAGLATLLLLIDMIWKPGA